MGIAARSEIALRTIQCHYFACDVWCTKGLACIRFLNIHKAPTAQPNSWDLMKDRSCVMAHSVSKLCSRHPTHRGQCQRCFNCFTKACCQRLNYEHSIPHYERLDSRLMHAASQHAAMLDLPRLLKRIGIHLSTSPHESARIIICLCHVQFKVISFAAT